MAPRLGWTLIVAGAIPALLVTVASCLVAWDDAEVRFIDAWAFYAWVLPVVPLGLVLCSAGALLLHRHRRQGA